MITNNEKFLKLRNEHLTEIIYFFRGIDPNFDDKEIFDTLCDSYNKFLIDFVMKCGFKW